MSEIAPYDDDELNEHGLRLRCRDLRAEVARLRESEVRMRAAMEHLSPREWALLVAAREARRFIGVRHVSMALDAALAPYAEVE